MSQVFDPDLPKRDSFILFYGIHYSHTLSFSGEVSLKVNSIFLNQKLSKNALKRFLTNLSEVRKFLKFINEIFLKEIARLELCFLFNTRCVIFSTLNQAAMKTLGIIAGNKPLKRWLLTII